MRSTSDTQVKIAHILRTTTNEIDGDKLRMTTLKILVTFYKNAVIQNLL